jgi:hypothetical protein
VEKPVTTYDYVVWLRPRLGVDGIRALRGLLKVASRRFGLQAIHIEEISRSDSEIASRKQRAKV